MLRQPFFRIVDARSYHEEGSRDQFGVAGKIFGSHRVKCIYGQGIINFVDYFPAPGKFFLVADHRRNVAEYLDLGFCAVGFGYALCDLMDPLNYPFADIRVEYTEGSLHLGSLRDNICSASGVELADRQSNLIKSRDLPRY